MTYANRRGKWFNTAFSHYIFIAMALSGYCRCQAVLAFISTLLMAVSVLSVPISVPLWLVGGGGLSGRAGSSRTGFVDLLRPALVGVYLLPFVRSG